MRRRGLLVAAAALGGIIVVAALAITLFYGRIGAWVIERKVLPRVQARLGRPLEIGAIEIERGWVTLRDVVVAGDDGEPLIKVPMVVIELAFWPSLVGTVELGEVTVIGARIMASRGPDGDDLAELLARLRGRATDAAASSDASGPR